MFSFEICERDMLARIGKIKTKSGVVETPVFLPVINPIKQPVKAEEMKKIFGCEALITNAYLLKKNFGDEPIHEGLHRFLGFPDTIMTDSGAYQILTYGEIEVTPEDIIEYQEKIDTDIATILDIPTGWRVSREYALYTVNETLRRARQLERLKERDDIAWVGPIQGGRFLDLISLSAKSMSELPFQIYALGSPTIVMEQYRFDFLVDMILTAKMNLPPNRPFHLFGAGHPFIFSLIAALGCDLFDSAAYSLYAKDGRYMTEYGTLRLEELRYLPCSCPVCSKHEIEDVQSLQREEREEFLTRHNLYVCISEMRRVKQSIVEGRLWEYMEMRAHGHPKLLQALKRLSEYSGYIEGSSPTSKRSGIFFFSQIGYSRPEITRYRARLKERYRPDGENLLLIPDLGVEFYRGRRFIEFVEENMGRINICIYTVPFGPIPIELKDVYPLSQYEVALPPEDSMIESVIKHIKEYVNRNRFKKVIILSRENTWEEKLADRCRKIISTEKILCEVVKLRKKPNIKDLTEITGRIMET